MNNEGKVLLGAGLAIGAVVLIVKSAKAVELPPVPAPDPEPTPEPPPILYTLTVGNSPWNGGGVAGGGQTYISTLTVDAGTVVTLTAFPFTDYTFDHWSGDASGTNLTISVTMTANKDILANFRYTPPANVPSVSTDPADNITHTEADLHGSVVNLGSYSSVLVAFLFGETTNYEMAPSLTQQISFPMPFTARVTGLTPGKTYHYKVIASVDGHTVYGEDQTFTAALIISTNGFTLGVINPGPNDTLFWFSLGGNLAWEPEYFAELNKIKPAPPGETLSFPLFIPGGTPLNVKIGYGTRNPDGSYSNAGFSYQSTFPIENNKNYIYDASTRSLI